MFAKLLYSYISHPGKTISSWQEKKPFLACISVILGVSFINALNLHNFQGIIFQTGLFFSFNCAFLIIHSCILDFFAQLLNLRAQSLNLFLWMGLSLLPFLLIPAFKLIFTNGLGIISTLVLIGSIILQIITLKSLYGISGKKSIFLFLIPWLLLVSFILFIGILVITALAFISLA